MDGWSYAISCSLFSGLLKWCLYLRCVCIVIGKVFPVRSGLKLNGRPFIVVILPRTRATVVAFRFVVGAFFIFRY